jgi:hypothetical protein
MAAKPKNLYLYLAAACFIGIILIFVFDGYMGLYDTLSVNTGEQPQTIAPEQWSESEENNNPVSLWPFSGGNLTFSYEVANRRFSAYLAEISISVWKNHVKVADILSTDVNISAFKNETVTWVIDPLVIMAGITVKDNQFTLEITNGSIKRSIIVHYSLDNIPQIIVK